MTKKNNYRVTTTDKQGKEIKSTEIEGYECASDLKWVRDCQSTKGGAYEGGETKIEKI